jgi:hypothetical protein
MSAAATTQAPYLFGYSEEESQRLQKQAWLFYLTTRPLLEDSGVGPGMHARSRAMPASGSARATPRLR